MINLLKGKILLGLVVAFATTAIHASESKGEFFGSKETEYPAWFKESFLNLKDDIEEAKTEKKRVMILFHQDGCPYCNKLVERNLAQKNIKDKVQKNFDVIAMNMWGDREVTYVNGAAYKEKDLALALKVQFTPTVIFYDEKGKIILRLNGYRSPYRFSTDLDYVIGRKEKETSYLDYIKANFKPSSSSKKIHPEDFYQKPPYDLRPKPGIKATAVHFEQTDCPNCDTLHEKVFPDKELRNVINQARNIQLDMWSSMEIITPEGKKTTAKAWAKKLDIKFAPSIVLFNDKGEEVIRSEAFFKVFHTQGIFKYTLSDGYKKEPSFQRWLTSYAEQFREQGQNVDIWRYANEKAGSKKKE